MNNNDLIADRIEEVIERMFAIFRSLEPGPTEYSIFYDPRKYASWIILIFFADDKMLKEGIKNGVCYQVYTYLLNELNQVTEISNIDLTILFESGNPPTSKIDIENLFEKLLVKIESPLKVDGKADIKTCGCCGHDFDKHQLLCFFNDEKDTPTEGWIMCPEENCNCFQTWSAKYKGESSLED